jgi:hypothetical protein
MVGTIASFRHDICRTVNCRTHGKQGTRKLSRPSHRCRKLGSYPRQNGLAVALRELGPDRTHALHPVLAERRAPPPRSRRLNKGGARNALARAVFLCRLGEIRDSSFEQQRYRASGLTLVTAAIVLWNTVYIDRAIAASTRRGSAVDPKLLKYLSPLGWKHINLTGDYQIHNLLSLRQAYGVDGGVAE